MKLDLILRVRFTLPTGVTWQHKQAAVDVDAPDYEYFMAHSRSLVLEWLDTHPTVYVDNRRWRIGVTSLWGERQPGDDTVTFIPTLWHDRTNRYMNRTAIDNLHGRIEVTGYAHNTYLPTKKGNNANEPTTTSQVPD